MPKLIDLTGQEFGLWTVLSIAGRTKHGGVLWRVRCKCGNRSIVQGSNLRNGGSTKCRVCYYKHLTTHGHSRGGKCTREYRSWNAMKDRCANPNHRHYKHYGGRGISVCPQWLESFERFLADMGPRPAGTSLDRYPDNNGNYEPGNCRWATPKEQRANQRSKAAA